LWAGREIGPAPKRIAPTAKDGQGSYDHWSKKIGLLSKTENDGKAHGTPSIIPRPNLVKRHRWTKDWLGRYQVAALKCRPL
jgi:hypothetical protein